MSAIKVMTLASTIDVRPSARCAYDTSVQEIRLISFLVLTVIDSFWDRAASIVIKITWGCWLFVLLYRDAHTVRVPSLRGNATPTTHTSVASHFVSCVVYTVSLVIINAIFRRRYSTEKTREITKTPSSCTLISRPSWTKI